MAPSPSTHLAMTSGTISTPSIMSMSRSVVMSPLQLGLSRSVLHHPTPKPVS
jgi:hypothetical protein